MQRRVPRLDDVRVGALVEQVAAPIAVWSLRAASISAVSPMPVVALMSRPGRHQQLDRLEVAVPGREQQRRHAALVDPAEPGPGAVRFERLVGDAREPSALRVAAREADVFGTELGAGIEVRLGVDAAPYDLVLVLRRPPTSARSVRGRRPCAFTLAPRREERLDDRDAAARTAVISGVSPVEVAALTSAPALSSRCTIARLPFSRGQRERRHAVVVLRVDVGAGREQQLDRFHVVPVRRPMQRGCAVGLRRVDVARCFSSARIAALSCCLAASASGRLRRRRQTLGPPGSARAPARTCCALICALSMSTGESPDPVRPA